MKATKRVCMCMYVCMYVCEFVYVCVHIVARKGTDNKFNGNRQFLPLYTPFFIAQPTTGQQFSICMSYCVLMLR
jgi:hypothetical protein